MTHPMTPTQPPGLRADEREALKPCPFCGGRPVLTVRPDNANATAYFAAVACFCGGYASCAHKDAIAIEPADAEAKAIAAWNARAALTPQPDTSKEREGLVQRLRQDAINIAHLGSGVTDAMHTMYDAASALAQPAAPVAVPDGYALVPVEPTPGMLASPAQDRPGFSPFVAREIWAAMLAASQPPASEPGAQQVDSMENHHGRRDDYQRLDRGSAVLLRASAAFPMAGFANSEIAERLWSSEAVMAVNADLGLSMDQLVRLVRAIFAQPAAQQAAEGEPTGCNCRWVGERQVQWCELHEAHEVAIHEWAGRAKDAEAKLRATPATQPAEPSEVRDAERWRKIDQKLNDGEWILRRVEIIDSAGRADELVIDDHISSIDAAIQAQQAKGGQ